jgi:hypothetical protein
VIESFNLLFPFSNPAIVPLQAVPKNDIPTGKPWMKPAGTVMCG